MYRIGIDLGGTNIAVGLVDESMSIIEKQSMPTLSERAPEAIVDDMAELCRRVAAAKGVPMTEIASVGVASPGIADDATGRVEYANNLPFRKFPLAALIRERLGNVEVHIANDANAAAWGEAVAGAAKGTSDSVMITLGTGVGAEFSLTDFGVLCDERGAPVPQLSARAEKALRERGGARVLISLTHARDVAAAIVLFVS